VSREKQRGPRTRFVVGAALVASLVLAIGGVLVVRDRQPPRAAASQPPATVTQQATPPPGVSWVPVAGVQVPVSRLHGPRISTGATASGFSRSERGAALAAVHVLVRTSAAAGPNIYRPTVTQQMIGANVAAMKLLLDQQYQELRAADPVPDGQAVTGDAVVKGYRVAAYGPDQRTSTIDVLLTSRALQASGQRLQFAVQLVWDHGDWRVVAPPRGDWSAAMTTLGSDPAGLLSYDEAG
jgi:hypothetical protein